MSDPAHVQLAFHQNEVLPGNVPRSVPLRIATGEGDILQWHSGLTMPPALASEITRAGFAVDPETLEITFTKNRWDGPFGGYIEEPEHPRPAGTVGMLHSTRWPMLSYLKQTIGVGAGQADLEATVRDMVEFNGELYVQTTERKIYKLENWSTTPRLTAAVFTHSNASAGGTGLTVHNGILYAAYGHNSSYKYAYSTDGATWVESGRTGTDDSAAHFLSHKGVLHRVFLANHSQSTTGEDAGQAWTSADEIADPDENINKMLLLDDIIVFIKPTGPHTMDSYGIVEELDPDIRALTDTGNGYAARTWHKKLFYNALSELKAIGRGSVSRITPA